MRWFVRVMTLIFMSFVFPVSMQVYGVVLPFNQVQNPEKVNSYNFFVEKNDTGAWFYFINRDSKAFIVQNCIPAIKGNIAFIDSVQAATIAQFIVDKLDGGVFPPSIQVSELDSLKIVY